MAIRPCPHPPKMTCVLDERRKRSFSERNPRCPSVAHNAMGAYQILWQQLIYHVSDNHPTWELPRKAPQKSWISFPDLGLRSKRIGSETFMHSNRYFRATSSQ